MIARLGEQPDAQLHEPGASTRPWTAGPNPSMTVESTGSALRVPAVRFPPIDLGSGAELSGGFPEPSRPVPPRPLIRPPDSRSTSSGRSVGSDANSRVGECQALRRLRSGPAHHWTSFHQRCPRARVMLPQRIRRRGNCPVGNDSWNTSDGRSEPNTLGPGPRSSCPGSSERADLHSGLGSDYRSSIS